MGKKEWDGEGFENSYVCHFFPEWLQLDVYLQVARASSILSSAPGCVVAIMLCFTSCVTFSRKVWFGMTICVFFICFFQGLIFIYFKSSLCNTYTQKQSEVWALEEFTAESYCTLGTSGVVSACAVALWFFTGCSMLCYPRPRSRED